MLKEAMSLILSRVLPASPHSAGPSAAAGTILTAFMLGIGLGGVTASGQDEKRVAIEPWHAAVAKAETADDLLSIALAIEDDITARLKSGETCYGELWRLAAHVSTLAGDTGRALRLLDAAIGAAEQEADLAEAYRMKGQILARTDPIGSRDAYMEAALILSVGGDGPVRSPAAYFESMLGWAKALRAIGDHTGAIEVRETMLGAIVVVSDAARASAFIENGRDCFAIGQWQQGRGWFDRARTESHEFLASKGRLVPLRVEAARAGIEDRAEEFAALLPLWRDPDLRAYPEAIQIAARLVALERHDPIVKLSIAIEAMDVWRANRKAWAKDVPAARLHGIDPDVRHLLVFIVLSGPSHGRSNEAVDAAIEFLTKFPTDPLAEKIDSTLTKLLGE